MPVVGVWMEYISNSVRLAKGMAWDGLDGDVGGAARGGLRMIHEMGVLQRDVKWRNVLVQDMIVTGQNNGKEDEGNRVDGASAGAGPDTMGTHDESANRNEETRRKKRVVWIDFSNAMTKEIVEAAGQNWDEEVQREDAALVRMMGGDPATVGG